MLTCYHPPKPAHQTVAGLADTLRQEHKLKLPGAFQAALAQIHKLKLATRNTRRFCLDKFAFVVIPYEI